MRSSISLGGANLWVGSKQERNPSEGSEHAGNAKRGQKSREPHKVKFAAWGRQLADGFG